jgi:hypothetical protein
MHWVHSGSNQKLEGELNCLVQEVIGADDFRVGDLDGFRAQRENRHLDKTEMNQDKENPFGGLGWNQKTIEIKVPTGAKNDGGRGLLFYITGLHFQSLKAIISSAFAQPQALHYHYMLFMHFCYGEHVFNELYMSDSWIVQNEKLQRQPREPGCRLEKVIAALMFWSDSTHLASFGTTKVWPLYLYLSNLSKYIWAKPNSSACNHVIYIPSVTCFPCTECLPFIHKLPAS